MTDPTPAEIADLLEKTLSDGELSKGERAAFRALLLDLGLPGDQLAFLRRRAFAMARTAMRDGKAPLSWLEAVSEVLDEARGGPKRGSSDAWFSPGDGCRQAIAEHFAAARSTVDVCVFTITDDRISDAIRSAARRGVTIRIVTDNEKAGDFGSDIDALRRAGIPVAIDTSPAHMHHKFVIFDQKTLLTGSYNWTRSAFQENQENLIALSEPDMIAAFQRVFDELWETFSS